MLAGIAVTIVACDNMANQPKRLPYELPAGKTAEANWPPAPPPGAVPRDDQPGTPPPLPLALLERRRARPHIACAPRPRRDGGAQRATVVPRRPAPPAVA